MTVTCPLCDEYEGQTQKQTATHIFTSGDDVHSGYNYQSAMATLDGDGGDRDDADDVDEQEGTDTDTVEFPDAPDADDTDDVDEPQQSDDVELPCSHESFDPTNAPEPPFSVTCEECNESWEVTSL